ncbi:MAG: 50S ribosomal protein L24 [Conexivisphaera sp.]
MGRGSGSGADVRRALSAHLADDLAEEYGLRSIRVRVGDVVKVVRGSYRGVEGKVLRVYPEEGRLAVEGLTRQNSRGENVPVKVHASKVIVTKLNLDDKIRRERLESLKSKKAEGEAHG